MSEQLNNYKNAHNPTADWESLREQEFIAETRETHALTNRDVFRLEANHEPLIDAEHSLYGAPALARIDIGHETALELLDLRDLPIDQQWGGHIMPNGSIHRADFLLVQPGVFLNHDLQHSGSKGIRAGEPSVIVGRNYTADRFRLDDAVSRQQFSIGTDPQGGILIQDLGASNPTKITVRRQREES